MPDFDLTGKVCVVTGGTKGIGHGIVRQLLGAGASVLLTSRSAADCDRVAADLGREFGADTVAGAACDLSDPEAVGGLLGLAAGRFGP
ncbi:MAG TPA: SDR family NAD(P)-dependent oxidoreductase, partial [Nocardioides sp.]